MDLGVGLDDAGLAQALCGEAVARRGQHRPRDVDAQDRSGRADQPGQRRGGLAAAAADVDHPITGLEPKGRHGGFTQRLDLSVQLVLHGGPGLACGGVPIGDLVAVGGRGLGHGASFPIDFQLGPHRRRPQAARGARHRRPKVNLTASLTIPILRSGL